MNYTILFFLILGVIIGLIKDFSDPGEHLQRSDNIFTFFFKDRY